MASRREFLSHVAAAAALGAPVAVAATASVAGPTQAQAPAPASGATDRAFWVEIASRVADPVLTNLAAGRLKATMPVEARPGSEADRAKFTHLEALGRLLAGLAPWLESGPDAGDEGARRLRFVDLARRSITSATDPASPDFVNLTEGGQPLVDAAFLAHALLRAPNTLWRALPPTTRAHVVSALKTTRRIKPGFSNWLLFSAMVEACLCAVGEDWDTMRVDYALRQHDQWYKGDGIYGDGPEFHWDYYNSFVIQPMLVDILATVSPANKSWDTLREPVLRRARRYAAIQERLISPEGAFPPIGRSLAYRAGAFQLLAQIALQHQLPDGVSPAQVRGALTAVLRRTMTAPGTFDRGGWLTVGFCGHQPSVGETYISTGSTYLCATAFLPLGLASTDEFWAAPPQDWTSRRAWAGVDLAADHAL
jgi:hypothetical protein